MLGQSEVLQQRTTSPSFLSHRTQRTIIIGAALIFIGITLAVIFTRSPWWDEGQYSDPAHTLEQKGYLGSRVMDGRGHPFVREFVAYDHYTYWTVPLYMVVLAGWIKVLGFSIVKVRLLSLLCGLVLVAAAGLVAWRLTTSRSTAVLAVLILATDYAVILSAATARMDMMSAAFGFAGLAAYLWFRERRLPVAAFSGAFLTAAAAFCHPTGALHIGGLLAIALFLDFRRLNWRVIAAAGVGYLIFGVAWGLYIAQAPQIFREQLRVHTAYRMEGLHSPIRAVLTDVWNRYLFHYSPGGPWSPLRLKAVIVLVYWAGILAAAFVPAIRRSPGVLLLLLLSVLYYVELAVLDAAEFPHYMVHVIAMWALLLAAVLSVVIRRRLVPPKFVAVGLCGFVLLQISGHLIKIHENTYRNEWLPTVAFIEAHSSPNSLIDAPSQFQFALNDRKLVDDARLGGLSGIHPDVIVLDHIHSGPQVFKDKEPDMEVFVNDVLTNRFHWAATYGDYRIFLPVSSARAQLQMGK